MPGGTPINPEGAATLVTALVGAGISTYAQTRGSPAPQLGSPRGTVRVSGRSKVVATTEGGAPTIPVSSTGRVTLSYQAPLRGGLNRLLGRKASVRQTLSSGGRVSTTQTVPDVLGRGSTTYQILQQQGVRGARVTTRRANSVSTRQVSRAPAPRAASLVEDLFAQQYTSRQLASDAVSQRAARTSVYNVDQRLGLFSRLQGSITQETIVRSVSKSRPTRFTSSRTVLTIPERGGVSVDARLRGSTRNVPTQLSVAGEGLAPTRELLTSSTRGPKRTNALSIDTRGVVGQAILDRLGARERPVRSVIEQQTRVSGELRVTRPRSPQLGRRGQSVLNPLEQLQRSQVSVERLSVPGRSLGLPLPSYGPAGASLAFLPVSGVRDESRERLASFQKNLQGSFFAGRSMQRDESLPQQRQAPVTILDVLPSQVVVTRTTPATSSQQRQSSSSSQRLSQASSFFTPPPFAASFSFPGMPSSPRLPPLLPGVDGREFGGFLEGGRTSRRYTYAPDLVSVAFGITARGRKARKLARRSFLGLESRPIIT